MSTASLGYLTAVFSAVFNGTFAALSKIPSVEKANVPPLIFQTYVCMGVFVTSWLALPFCQYNHSITYCHHTKEGCDNIDTTFSFTPLGIAAGALLVFALFFSFGAIQLIGLSLAQGIWGGSAVLVSFLWGVIAFPNDQKVSIPLSILALVLLASGIFGIAFCQQIASFFWKKSSWKEHSNHLPGGYHTMEDHSSSEYGTSIHGVQSTTANENDEQPQSETSTNFSSTDQLRGYIYAITVGVFGGSILVPMHYVDKQAGIVFVPSFGIGALLASVVLFVVQYGIIQRKNPFDYANPSMVFLTAIAGMTSGAIWNLGNTMTIIGIPRIGYEIAMPIQQCALFISGLLGVFVFKEITGYSIIVFFASGFVLVGGAIVLALAKNS